MFCHKQYNHVLFALESVNFSLSLSKNVGDYLWDLSRKRHIRSVSQLLWHTFGTLNLSTVGFRKDLHKLHFKFLVNLKTL